MKLNFKKSKIFWLYITVGILTLIFSVILAPFWQGTEVPFKSWGPSAVNITMGIAVVLYLALFLAKRLKRSGNVPIQMLTIVEFVFLSFIALSCFLTQFDLLQIARPCLILGIALWCRGGIEVVRAYYYRGAGDKNYPLWYLAIAIGMITFGTYIFATPTFTSIHLQWLIVITIALLGVFLIFYGIKVKPQKSK